MDPVAVAAAAACVSAVGALLAGHVRSAPRVVAVAKTTASAAVLALALALGAAASAYGRLVLAALALSLAGDVALLPQRTGRAFYAGMAAFALAHVAYALAFALLGVAPPWVAAGGLAALGSSTAVLVWLTGRTPRPALVPVAAYAAVMSVMAAMATGAYGAGASALVPAGAWLFVASDVFVVRNRFVHRALANKLVGLPLYYAAQIALAASVAMR